MHIGSGCVLAITASHAESSAQVVTLYDGLTAASPVLLRLHLPAGSMPLHIAFPDGTPLRFALGLFADPGNCAVHVITIGE